MKNLDKIDLKEKAGNYILTIKDFKEILKMNLLFLILLEKD